MRLNGLSVTAVVLSALLLTSNAFGSRRIYTLTGLKHADTSTVKRPSPGPEGEKPFADLIKDKVVIPGLFTFYQDTSNNSVYMAIRRDQFDRVFLCGETRSAAEGAFFDNGAMTSTYPFYLQRVGKKVMLMEKNLRFRADTSSTLRRAVEAGISDHLLATFKIESKPNDSGAILVDPSAFFVRDAGNVSYLLGQMAQTGISFDRENSYYGKIKSFPLNSEIDVKLHFRTSKPISAATMQNPYSLFHTYHYSLSTLPQTDYVPRLADDRVGHFLMIFEDYSHLDQETPYVRYVERWNVKKKDPSAAMSEPVEPIVFWVENTVPPEYRDAVVQGIEFWNKSFEKIGLKNVMVAKQMPDTASWDPADVRYNVVRWIMMPGGGYAVGPSRANPFTGQIYDADIRISSDFIRYMFGHAENFLKPVSFDGSEIEDGSVLDSVLNSEPGKRGYFEDYARQSAQEAAFGLDYILSANGDLANKDSLTRAYISSYIVEVVAHEVGHTLGLRHNFKASSIYSWNELLDTAFTRKNSTLGTIMDYMPPIIAGKGKTQGEFYPSVPGPYDDWAIAYAYSDFGAKTPQEELTKLEEIGSRAGDTLLVYATDEDLYGDANKSIDPMVNLFDQGKDVIGFAEHKIDLTRELWTSSIKEFEKPGVRYQKILTVFQNGWRSYIETVSWVPKFVGGIYHNRTHIGDPNGKLPFEPVAAADQKRAVEFLARDIFAADAFDLPQDLLNKLQPENFEDFEGTVWSSQQIDYPFHQRVLSIQRRALDKLYGYKTVGRLLNNEALYKPGEAHYTMNDMFTEVRRAIWSEVSTPKNINSFRRQLQLVHLSDLIDIYLAPPALYPGDARALAANDIDIIETAANRAIGSAGLDDMTRIHLKEVARQISVAKKAQRQYFPGPSLGSGD